jgi:DNA invertase Pin-like site-specific DNA recombinase
MTVPIHGATVDLYLHQQAIDTSTHSGRAMFQMLGVFAASSASGLKVGSRE